MHDLDYPCLCGHLAGQHAMNPVNFFKFCIFVPDTCKCNDFKPDNLRYLEMASDENKL